MTSDLNNREASVIWLDLDSVFIQTGLLKPHCFVRVRLLPWSQNIYSFRNFFHFGGSRFHLLRSFQRQSVISQRLLGFSQSIMSFCQVVEIKSVSSPIFIKAL